MTRCHEDTMYTHFICYFQVMQSVAYKKHVVLFNPRLS
jgi:hypothetical protein